MAASDSPPPFLPYGRQWIDAADEAAVLDALRSPLIAHGPRVEAFERAFAAQTGAQEAVACSSGTAALHLALTALDLPHGARAVVPAVTFLATATATVMAGLQPVFCDVDPDSGLMTPETLSAVLTDEVAVVLPVHLGGAICDMAALHDLAASRGVRLIEDACHAIGGRDAHADSVGASRRSEASTFSLHPVKTLAAGEGGMITLNDAERAARLRRLRNHAVTREPARMGQDFSRDPQGALNPWAYEQLELGFNYRMNELEAALGLSQLGKLEAFAARRRTLAALYDARLAAFAPMVRPSARPPGQDICRHLYTVLIDFEGLGLDRAALMRRLSAAGIGTQVHYIPLYRQPYFHDTVGSEALAGAEAWYNRVLALPLFPAMVDDDVDRVVNALAEALAEAS